MHSRLLTRTAGLAAALALCAMPAAAALYKWVDANGRTVYSDQPPTSPNLKAETLNAVAPASNPNAAKELAQKDLELRKRQAERAEVATKGDKDRVAKEKRAEECAQIANAIKQLSWSQVVILRANAQGEQVPMDDSAREKEKARLEALSKENCS
jgi:hypothetical protein